MNKLFTSNPFPRLYAVGLAALQALALSGCTTTFAPHKEASVMEVSQLSSQHCSQVINHTSRAGRSSIPICHGIELAVATHDELIANIGNQRRLVNAIAIWSTIVAAGLGADAAIDDSPDAIKIGSASILAATGLGNWLTGRNPVTGGNAAAQNNLLRLDGASKLACAVNAVGPLDAVDDVQLRTSLNNLREGIEGVEEFRNLVALNLVELQQSRSDEDRAKIKDYLGSIDLALEAAETTHRQGAELLRQIDGAGRTLQSLSLFVRNAVRQKILLTQPTLDELQKTLNDLIAKVPTFLTFPAAQLEGMDSNQGDAGAGNGDGGSGIEGDSAGSTIAANVAVSDINHLRTSLQGLGRAYGKVKSASMAVRAYASIDYSKVETSLKGCGIDVPAPGETISLSSTSGTLTGGKDGNTKFSAKGGSGSFTHASSSDQVRVAQNGASFTASISAKTPPGKYTIKIADAAKPDLFSVFMLTVTKPAPAPKVSGPKSSEHVKGLQTSLAKLGLYWEKVDGVCGSATKTAANSLLRTIQISPQGDVCTDKSLAQGAQSLATSVPNGILPSANVIRILAIEIRMRCKIGLTGSPDGVLDASERESLRKASFMLPTREVLKESELSDLLYKLHTQAGCGS